MPLMSCSSILVSVVFHFAVCRAVELGAASPPVLRTAAGLSQVRPPVRRVSIDATGRVASVSLAIQAASAEANVGNAMSSDDHAKEYNLTHTQTQTHAQASDPWVSMIHVWCGGHAASECGACTQELGKDWCNGDCEWVTDECLFRRDRVWCGNRAVDDCSQCMDPLGHAPGGIWCDGQCAWRATTDGMGCVPKNGAEEMVPEESLMPRKIDKPLAEQMKKPSVSSVWPEFGIAKGLPPGYNIPGAKTGGFWNHFMPGGAASGGDTSTTAAPGGTGESGPLSKQVWPTRKQDIITIAAPKDNFPLLTGDERHKAIHKAMTAEIQGSDDVGTMPETTRGKKPCPKNANEHGSVNEPQTPMPVAINVQATPAAPPQKAAAPSAKPVEPVHQPRLAQKQTDVTPSPTEADVAEDNDGTNDGSDGEDTSSYSEYAASPLTPPIVRAAVAATSAS